METYEKDLFAAFVWAQAVENGVRNLILHRVDDGRLNFDEEECTKLAWPQRAEIIRRRKQGHTVSGPDHCSSARASHMVIAENILRLRIRRS